MTLIRNGHDENPLDNDDDLNNKRFGSSFKLKRECPFPWCDAAMIKHCPELQVCLTCRHAVYTTFSTLSSKAVVPEQYYVSQKT